MPGAADRYRWDFEVEDLEKVPREYFILDPVKVRKAIRGGVRDIPGLSIYLKKPAPEPK